MRPKVLSYLGFAAKARKIATGYNTSCFMMEKKKVKLMLLAEDLSDNSKNKMISIADRYKVPYLIYGNMDELSHITGMEGKGIFSITDDNLAKVISQEIDNNQSLEKEVF